MKVLAILACAFVAVSLGDVEGEIRVAFDKFVSTHNKLYSSPAEKAHRFRIFSDNYVEMLAHNERSTWKKGITQFSDLTAEEFKTFHLNGYVNTHKHAGGFPASRSALPKDLPESVDWRDKGAVTEVKDQGACGSCWAFAATQQMESYVMINNGTLPVLSAQHITSCTPNPLSCGGTGGCMGSIPQLAWSYVQLFGLLSEEDMPYTSGTTASTGDCEYDANSMTAKATARGYETLPHNSLEAVMNHIANVGPLAVSVDASAWSSYSSGVFDSCDYNQNININHAVQMVGYGTDPQEGDYWIVRNSWGSGWGENGYIRLKRESTAVCGTDSTPLMGTACVDDGNDVQTTCGMCGVLFDTSYPIGAIEI